MQERVAQSARKSIKNTMSKNEYKEHNAQEKTKNIMRKKENKEYTAQERVYK